MADPKPRRPGTEKIVDEIVGVRREQRDQRRSSGTQRENAVRKLREALAALQVVVEEQAALLATQGQQQAQLAAQQQTLTDQQAALSAQVSFLQSATSYASNGAVTNGNRGASGGISLDGYNASFDCQVSLRTSSTGKLAITVGANLGGGEGISAVIGYEVIWAGGSIPIDWTRCAAAGSGLATTSRTSFVTVPANTDVTVRTRRGWQGGQSGLCIWAYQSLQVTKEGL